MQKSKSKNKVVRFIGGIAFLLIFAIFAVISCKYAVHSDLCYPNFDTGREINLVYGYDREAFLKTQPEDRPKSFYDLMYESEAQQVPVYQEVPANVEEAPAAEVPAEEVAVQEEKPVSPASAKAKEKGLPEPPAIDITSWEYMLVNPDHLLESTYEPESKGYLNMTAAESDVQTSYNDQRCCVDLRIAQALLDFASGCREAGLPVYLSSGYRSYDEQNYLFQRKVSQGYSDAEARTIVAYPGSSEHQTGLCCDITDRYREFKDSSLAETDTYKWLAQHCTEYGFVVRYPEDKSGSADSITGVIYEPWHFRYVGKEVAEYMTANNLCLEEFVELYE